MKCTYCQKDVKYKERSGRRCPFCQHVFVFEPKEGDPVTDAAFLGAIERVSAQGKVKFNRAHLYYELLRSRKRSWAGTVVFGLGSVGALGAGLSLHQGALLIPFVVMVVGAFAAKPTNQVSIPREKFESLLERWEKFRGQVAGLIVRKNVTETSRPPLPADIPEYSFDRAVICDRDETVDLLLANHFHFENNCAVLGVKGYPPQAFETVRAMLRKNPKLEVYVLHDATMEGCTLAQRLRRSSDWFQPKVRIVDVGLRPHHAARYRGLWQIAEDSSPRPWLSAAELRWLGRYSMELAVIRPEQVIKRLFRAITLSQELPDASADGPILLDAEVFARPAVASDGGGDSFG